MERLVVITDKTDVHLANALVDFLNKFYYRMGYDHFKAEEIPTATGEHSGDFGTVLDFNATTGLMELYDMRSKWFYRLCDEARYIADAYVAGWTAKASQKFEEVENVS